VIITKSTRFVGRNKYLAKVWQMADLLKTYVWLKSGIYSVTVDEVKFLDGYICKMNAEW